MEKAAAAAAEAVAVETARGWVHGGGTRNAPKAEVSTHEHQTSKHH